MIKTIKAAAAAALAAMSLAACGSTAPPVSPPVPVLAAANPVTILREMHVPIPPGVEVGQVDIEGDRYAVGQFANGEQVTVYAYADESAEDESVALNPSNDVNKLLVGRLFTVIVTGVDDGNGIVFPTPLAELEQASGAVAE